MYSTTNGAGNQHHFIRQKVYEHQTTHPEESEDGQWNGFDEAVPAVDSRHLHIHRAHFWNGGLAEPTPLCTPRHYVRMGYYK